MADALGVACAVPTYNTSSGRLVKLMSHATSQDTRFRNRRDDNYASTPPGVERRQFNNSHDELSPRAREMAIAIDEYKLRHRRRFITFEEMLHVLEELGYTKPSR